MEGIMEIQRNQYLQKIGPLYNEVEQLIKK